MTKKIGVVIVSYKTGRLVTELLDSLPNNFSEFCSKIIIVDNCSGDDSAEQILSWIELNSFSSKVELVISQMNGGYSFGNNLGIKTLQYSKEMPDYVLLLNPDTLVTNSTFSSLVNFMDSNPLVGIAGSQLISTEGDIQCSAFRFPSILSELSSALKLGVLDRLLSKWTITPRYVKAHPERVGWVAGASMMIRREVFDEIGLMDDEYFLYFEETDFCLQAHRNGWECWYVPDSVVTHYVGQSTGVISGDKQRRRRPKYWFESRQRYFLKNHGIFYTMLADFVWGVGFAVWRIRRAIQRKPNNDPKYMLWDFWRNSIFFSWFK